MTRIKFCGLTREDDVLFAEELGVDFIGLIFIPSSKRYVTLERAKKLRSLMKHAQCVGVFMGQSPDEISSISQEMDLQSYQIYDSTPSLLRDQHSPAIIHAYRYVPEQTILRTISAPDSILLDGALHGASSDHERIAMLPEDLRNHLFLAGGLTPDNVTRAVQKIRPFAVDVCRGIEHSPGIKDIKKMRCFADVVRSLSLPS